MSTLIAVAGKGGTGKTTVASMIIRLLAKRSRSILAIDADPNNNLWHWLNFKRGATIMDIVEDINRNKDKIAPGMTKERYIDLRVQEAIEESDGLDLLAMGRPEGPGCYCYANNLLRDVIERISDDYEYVVCDNEAGMEHFSRRVMRSIDRLFVVSDFSVVGIRSARNIVNLLDRLDLNIKEKLFIINKVTSDAESLRGEIELVNIELAGFIPFDRTLETLSVEGASIFGLKENSPAFFAMKNILFKKEEQWIA